MSNDDSNGKRKNILDAFQIFVENNHQNIKIGLYSIGGVVAFYLARKIHLTSVFRHADEIPVDFIKKQVRLQGKVTQVGVDGLLNIQHIPILELRVPFTQRKDRGCLLVHVACIDVGPQGKVWLKENALNKTVWFHLLHRASQDGVSQLYSKVDIQKSFKPNICINEELLKLGLSKITQISDMEHLDIASNPNMVKYVDRLVKLEHQAAQKGVGMWTSEDSKEMSKVKRAYSIVKSVILSPVHGIQWVYRKLKKK